MPSLVLQPLVENAIKHGVARKAGPAHIQITVRRDGDKLWMEVRDDGVGLSQEGWLALHKGIGVSTTRERLLRLFGADFRFEFHCHNPGLAVVVRVSVALSTPRPPTNRLGRVSARVISALFTLSSTLAQSAPPNRCPTTHHDGIRITEENQDADCRRRSARTRTACHPGRPSKVTSRSR